jgi:hypothetical protein
MISAYVCTSEPACEAATMPPGADVKFEHLQDVSASVSGVAVLTAEFGNVSAAI